MLAACLPLPRRSAEPCDGHRVTTQSRHRVPRRRLRANALVTTSRSIRTRATWRGNDGRYYCKKKNGTTGLLIGGAAGALLGREIAGRGDHTLGTILGVAGGALLGREVDAAARGCRCR